MAVTFLAQDAGDEGIAFHVTEISSVDQPVIGNPLFCGARPGGGSLAVQFFQRQGPYRVISTVAEPVMGTTSAGVYRLTAGFPATLPNTLPPSGNIFRDSFE